MQPNYLYLPTVDSTNKYLKERADSLPDFTVCYSFGQYAGVGRRGNKWSGNGEGMLAASFLLHSALIQDMPVLPLLCALCAVRVLKRKTKAEFLIKWPNDVVLMGKKICGILCESRIIGEKTFAVCGIGFNLLAGSDFYMEENLPHAGSVYSLTGIRLEAEEVLWEFIAEFDGLFAQYRREGSFRCCLEEYSALSVNTGREVRAIFPQGEQTGLCVGIGEDGALLLEIDGEVRQIRSGEASVRGLYGYV